MKLELKHIAGYLPYGLKLTWPSSTIELWCGNVQKVIDRREDSDSSRGVPILRPLSDLHKLENKEDLLGLSEMDLHLMEDNVTHKEVGSVNTLVSGICFEKVQYLLSKHYDIYDLIGKGLAVDINTLK